MRIRIPPPLLAVGTAALMWYLDQRLPILRWLLPPWNRLGWVFIGAGLSIDAAAVAAFARARTTANPIHIERAQHLVTGGLYRVSRNPMYLGLLSSLCGWALLLGSVAPFLGIILFERILVMAQIRPEEAALAARFGDDYLRYTHRVRRWLGRSRQ